MRFTTRELKAMAWGYGISVPAGLAAINYGASFQIAALIFGMGFAVTLWRLNS